MPVVGPIRVRVIILLPEEADIDEVEGLRAAAANPAFDFLKEPEEDIGVKEAMMVILGGVMPQDDSFREDNLKKPMESTMYKPTKEQQNLLLDFRFVGENLFAKNVLYREIRQICAEFIQKIDHPPCPARTTAGRQNRKF